ncbi:MAG: hypothetical protein N4A37_03010 [Prolixibacteraceae bacterium]|nr:hypothetical protein [Prolixibacteraceae bacterium]
MVPSWFLHGLSIDSPFSMEEPWRKHGQTMEKAWRKYLENNITKPIVKTRK